MPYAWPSVASPPFCRQDSAATIMRQMGDLLARPTLSDAKPSGSLRLTHVAAHHYRPEGQPSMKKKSLPDLPLLVRRIAFANLGGGD